EEERYDGYLQLENGVGMVRLMLDEFAAAMEERRREDGFPCHARSGEMSVATGVLAFPYLQRMAREMMQAYPEVRVYVYPIANHFFGEKITVSGLLTGQDIREQLTGKRLGDTLLLPENVLRSGEDVFLDDLHVGDLEKALQVPINIVKSSGHEFVETVLRYTE
ncbi:MAG: DUF512 domain-containing protein, partial [bacterium]|nr:DUF512 domain-containing protein [bacterium]